MASLELRNKTYRVVFMYGGKKYGSFFFSIRKATVTSFRAVVTMATLRLLRLRSLQQNAPIGPGWSAACEFSRS
jgi:hypothetical protein